MIYGLQHNGKGPYHLIPEGMERDELCGYHNGNMSGYEDIEYRDGIWYDLDHGKQIEDWDLKSSYCKKCIRAAIKLEQKVQGCDATKA